MSSSTHTPIRRLATSKGNQEITPNNLFFGNTTGNMGEPNSFLFCYLYLKMKRINPYKIVGKHPYLDAGVDLKWYRGASRYNNGATRYGRKYEFRHRIALAKVNPYKISN